MIPVLPLTLRFDAPRPIPLQNYAGALWRSALGAALRHQVCVTGASTCHGCRLLHRCTYGYLFDTPQPATARGLAAQYTTLPHPYILSPALQKTGHPGELALDVTLIGPGARCLPDVLAAARRLRVGDTPLELRAVEWRPPDGTARRVSLAETLELTPERPIPSAAPARARIELLNPLRLRRQKQYVGAENFSFEIFLTALLRRITLLGALADPQPPDFDARTLAMDARYGVSSSHRLDWHDLHRRSARQGQRMPMGGLKGTIDLAGNQLGTLWPWLWLGQWIHVGKLTTMGLGRYRLVAG